jgi:hypothetical protein
MPLPYTDETVIVDGICACLTTEVDRIISKLDEVLTAVSTATATVTKLDELLAYLESVIGTEAQRDGSRSMLEWQQSLIGTSTERDNSNSLITALGNILGRDSDRDANKPLALWFHEMFGKIEDLPEHEGEPTSFMTQFLAVVGDFTSDWLAGHSEESLLTAALHKHNRHMHEESDPHGASDWDLQPIGNPYGGDNPKGGFGGNISYPVGAILVQEFFTNQDLDSGGGSGDSTLAYPPQNSSVYGKSGGFMIDDTSDDFPPMLESVHSHPSFETPDVVLTWQEYQDSLG